MAEQGDPSGVGNYLGTTVDGKWWKRYRGGNFFARGNGEFRFDTEKRELRFRRYLTREPIVLPFAAVEDIAKGSWHAGMWCLGREAVVFHWREGGRVLNSGFPFSPRDHETIWAFLQAHLDRRAAPRAPRGT